MKPKLISIIIPCYNDAEYVEQAIKSALMQTYPTTEIIVVDDGSDKKTKVILNKLKPQLTKLITQTNHGQSAARNNGIRESKGEVIFVLDSDDFMEPEYCTKAIIKLADEQIKLVCSNTRIHIKNKGIVNYQPDGGDISHFLFSNGATGSVFFRKVDWESVGGYDETMRNGWEDWEYFIRLLASGGKCFVIREYLFNYRRRRDSTTFRANKKKYELMEYIFHKHKDLYKSHMEKFIDYNLTIMKSLENDKLRRDNSLEYKIGKFVLKPYRLLTFLVKSSTVKT
jgi:glycosyltransferase involved in cell wall biosynthesis